MGSFNRPILSEMTSPLPKGRGAKPSQSQRSFAENVLRIFQTRFILLATTFVTGVITARLIGVEARGAFAALTMPALVAVSLSELGVRQAAAYHIGRKGDPLPDMLSALGALWIGASVLGVGLTLAYDYATGLTDRYGWGLAMIAALLIPVTVATNYAAGIFIGIKNITALNQSSWIPPAARLVGVIILVGALGWGLTGALMAQTLGATLFAAYAAWLIFRLSKPSMRIRPELIKSLSQMGWRFAIALFVLSLSYRVNTFLLQTYSNLTEVGLYTTATTLAELLWQIPSAIGSLVLAHGVNSKDTVEFSQKSCTLFRLTLVLGVVVAVGLALVSPIFVPLIYGQEFANSANVVIALLPGVVVFLIFKTLNMDLASKGKPLIALLAAIPSLAVNMAAGAILVPRFGAVGAGVAASLGYIVGAAIFLFFYARVVAIPMAEILRYRRSDFSSATDRFRSLLPKSLRRGKA